jgi:hypothetical protein
MQDELSKQVKLLLGGFATKGGRVPQSFEEEK